MADSTNIGAVARVPEDVWRVVLAYATDYDDDVSTFEWSDPGMHPRRVLNPPAPQKVIRAMTSTALRTTMDAMRVSRLWADMTLPLLYTVLPIFTTMQLSLLAERLERSRTQGRYDLGRWTRELFVFLPRYGSDAMQGDADGCDVARIVRCCPQLRLYSSYVFGSAESKDVPTALAMTCGASLRYLYWTGTGPCLKSWWHLLACAPGLRTMGVAKLQDVSDRRAPELPVLACLEHVTVTCGVNGFNALLDGLTSAELPALWSVTIWFSTRTRGQSALREFFAVHGTKIRMLKIVSTIFAAPAELVGMLLGKCPGVVDLFLRDPTAEETISTGQHPSVCRLAITSKQHGSVGSVALKLRRALPGLQYLRVVDLFRTPAAPQDCDLAASSAVQRKVMEFGRRVVAHPAMEGVVLEDATGQVIA